MSPLAGDPQPVLADRLSIVLKRKLDAENDLKAYDWAVLDFRTGEVVWEKLMGAGDKFDSIGMPVFIGPNKALYGPLQGGLMMLKDAP